MAAAITFASPSQFWYSGGVWDASWIAWIHFNVAPDRRSRLQLGGARTYEDAEYEWPNVRDRMRRKTARPPRSRTSLDGTTRRTGRMERPGISPGWPPPEPDSQLRAALIIGPWPHGIGGMSRTQVGEREYGDVGRIDYDETVLRWLDRHVRDLDNGVDRKKPVRVFVMGSNRWIEADSWPLPGLRADTLHLSQMQDSGSTTIVSDPTRPVEGAFAERSGAHDYRELAKRSDVAVFETTPLTRDMTVVGAMHAELYVSVDAPDTDVSVAAQQR